AWCLPIAARKCPRPNRSSPSICPTPLRPQLDVGRGVAHIQVMAEPVVMIQEIRHDLVAVVAENVITPAAAVQEDLCTEEAALFPFTSRITRHCESRNRLTDQTHGIGEIMLRVPVHDP